MIENNFDTNSDASIAELRFRLIATNVSPDEISNATTISAATIYRFLADDNGISIQTFFKLIDFCKQYEKQIANELSEKKKNRVKKRGELVQESAPV